jgi:hypothetical protein
MRTSMAYFAGAGTVVVAVVAGLGGGLLISNIVSPHSPAQEMTKVERHRSAETVAASSAPSEPGPYLAATQPAATKPVVVAPAPDQAPTPSAPQRTEAANNSSPAARPAEAREASITQPSPSTSPPSPAPAAPLAAGEQAASPRDAFAKAREADVKRAAVEKRRTDRRQQWAERHGFRQRQDQELRDVERKVREETEPTQALAAEPARVEMPRVRLFDSE